jgi:membrane protease YdiL (CAAX protease family)
MNPFGPIMAVPLILLLFDGKDGLKAWFRRITRIRATRAVYLAAIVIPAAIICGSVAIAMVSGSITADPENSLLGTGLGGLVLVVLFAPLFGPIPEEPSFRGFAQDELQQTMTPLAASLWVGIGVLVWHLPVLWLRQVPWPIAIALPAVSVVYGWLYQTGESVWPLIALHSIQNIIGGMFVGSFFTPEENTIWIGYLAAFYVLWAAWIIWRTGTSLESPSLKIRV